MALRMHALGGGSSTLCSSRRPLAPSAAAAPAATASVCRICACHCRASAAVAAPLLSTTSGPRLPPRAARLGLQSRAQPGDIARGVAVGATSGPAEAGCWADTSSSTAQQTGRAAAGQAHHQQHRQQRAAAAAPFASLTRVLLIGQPSNLVRALAGRTGRFAGPVSLLMFLVGLLLGIISAVRALLVRRVRACQCCKGYGIVRCRLCNGEGTVAWMGKNNHQEMCPLCMTRRYVTCSDCGGYHHKKMFVHVPALSASRGLVPDLLG